jgi:hypothetical protein
MLFIVLLSILTSFLGYTKAYSGLYQQNTIISVSVGANKQLRFDPPFLLKTNPGQLIHFDFRALNHTLTESSFNSPCTKLTDTDIDTNFNNFNPLDIPNFKPVDVIFYDNRPRFFFCEQGNKSLKSHCGKGMVFAVNVNQTIFDQFVVNAEVDGLGIEIDEQSTYWK